MARSAIVIIAFLLAAGCRAGFPSLNEAPEQPPERLAAARDAAAAERARLEAARQSATAERGNARPSAAARPAQLLAALPAGVTATDGVVARAAAAAEASGRALEIVAVGQPALAAAQDLQRRFRARGILARLSQRAQAADRANSVELYLAP